MSNYYIIITFYCMSSCYQQLTTIVLVIMITLHGYLSLHRNKTWILLACTCIYHHQIMAALMMYR